jgi:hypothetical protein
MAVPESLQTGPAAVLTLRISKLKSVYVWRGASREPDHVAAGAWRPADRRNRYLARFHADDCAAYFAAAEDFYWSPMRAQIATSSNGDLASYLGLEELELVPERYLSYVDSRASAALRKAD